VEPLSAYRPGVSQTRPPTGLPGSCRESPDGQLFVSGKFVEQTRPQKNLTTKNTEHTKKRQTRRSQKRGPHRKARRQKWDLLGMVFIFVFFRVFRVFRGENGAVSPRWAERKARPAAFLLHETMSTTPI
jgi:hypothetical protein